MHTQPVFGYQREIEGRIAFYAERCAYFMRTGGGALPREAPAGDRRGPRALTDEQKRTCVAMAAGQNVTCSDIARALGVAQCSIRHHLLRHGITLPDGRAVGLSMRWKHLKK